MKTEQKHERKFWCDTCDPELRGEGVDITAIKAHIESVHGLIGRVSGRKELVLALDGDFYQNTYRWTLPDNIKLTEVRSGPK